MDNHKITNLPNPLSNTEPVTRGYADTHYSGGGGSKGPKGDKGDQGPRGPKGDQGPQGPQDQEDRKDQRVTEVYKDQRMTRVIQGQVGYPLRGSQCKETLTC